MNTDEIKAALDAKVQEAIDLLKNHFDAVQIQACYYEPEDGETYTSSQGVGCWWSRVGMADAFLERHKEEEHLGIRKRSQE